MLAPSYDLDICEMGIVRDLCKRHHGYGSVGNNATYAYAVWESSLPVAAFIWQPPPPGAARSVCPEAPQGVLSLSRMVAVPREERRLRHISKPLRRQMRMLIDRSRWPVLLTYSDEGEGHTGYVYKISGWTPTRRARRPVYRDIEGRRVSSYADGRHDTSALKRDGWTWIQRWEQWACPIGGASAWLDANGWRRVPVPGKRWRSGAQAYTYIQHQPDRFAGQ